MLGGLQDAVLYRGSAILNRRAVWYNTPRQEVKMASFNRIVTTLLLLALIPVITVGLIAPREAVQLLLDILDQIESQLDPSPSTLQMLIMALLALAIDGVLVFLLYLEVRRPTESSVRVQQVKGGEAHIAVDSVVNRVGYQIDRLPGVLDVTPTVTPRRGGVEVVLDIEMAGNGNLSANIEEISAVTRRVIEEDMGLKLKGKPKLNLRTVDYPGPVLGVGTQTPAFTATDPTLGEDEPEYSDDDVSALIETDEEPKSGEADESGRAGSAS